MISQASLLSPNKLEIQISECLEINSHLSVTISHFNNNNTLSHHHASPCINMHHNNYLPSGLCKLWLLAVLVLCTQYKYSELSTRTQNSVLVLVLRTQYSYSELSTSTQNSVLRTQYSYSELSTRIQNSVLVLRTRKLFI